MPTPLTERVRAASRAVAERSRAVGLDRRRLRALASAIEAAELVPPPLDPEVHWLGHGRESVAFLITLDCVNFGSGWFSEIGQGPRSYFDVARALRARFERRGPFTAAELEALDPEGAAELFGAAREDRAARELTGLFAAALNQLGRLARSRFGGDPAALADAAGGSAEGLMRELLRMPFYNDVASWRRGAVPFWKRAQITAADLALSGEVELSGLERLTSFADDLIPHVLRTEGVLRYAPELAARIESGRLLPAQSASEVEIRASAVHAVELLRTELAARGLVTTPVQIDWLLWNRGQAPRFAQHPRHRTKTVYY